MFSFPVSFADGGGGGMVNGARRVRLYYSKYIRLYSVLRRPKITSETVEYIIIMCPRPAFSIMVFSAAVSGPGWCL